MSFLVQGQITLIKFLRRVSHQTDSLFDVLNHRLQQDEGLLEEELEENNEAPPSPEWFGLEVGADERQNVLEFFNGEPSLKVQTSTLTPCFREESQDTPRVKTYEVRKTKGPSMQDEGLLEEELEENNEAPPSPEWFGLEVSAELIIHMEEAEGCPIQAKVPPALSWGSVPLRAMKKSRNLTMKFQ
ncbi:hypothetical protein LSTR_LSTR013752 [Laodelphax striatellus]|uniref:Uncharacterized protein n=1 Tax=Laodelphax striatellus TaxID=195883 RepID=A0A482WKN2_LAOST|nr:hypothetical protein LSTR_LSTR013752 [Laodelphax striatellus]